MPEKPNLDPTDADLDIVTDEARRDAGLGPVKRTPPQGIRDMQARIQENTELKAGLLRQLDAAGNDAARTQELWSAIAEINTQLQEAAARLAEYELQARSEN